MAYKYKIFDAISLTLLVHYTHVCLYSFQSYWYKYRKQNMSVNQGILKCSLLN